MARLAALLLVCGAASLHGGSQPAAPVAAHSALLRTISSVLPLAVDGLLSAYNAIDGTFSLPPRPGFIAYWTTAYSIETLAGAYPLLAAPQQARVRGVFANTAAKTRYVDVFRDDALWWAHAWARAAAATGDGSFLDTSRGIFANLTGAWSGWNATCGGMEWNKTCVAAGCGGPFAPPSPRHLSPRSTLPFSLTPSAPPRHSPSL